MQASSSLAACSGMRMSGTGRGGNFPSVLRAYVGAIPVAALALMGVAASRTIWTAADLLKFLLLLGCGMVSVAATPAGRVPQERHGEGFPHRVGAAGGDPAAADLRHAGPDPLQVVTQWRVHRGVVYRRVFTAAAISLAYGAASLLFRAFPASFAGPAIGAGARSHLDPGRRRVRDRGGRGHHFLIVGAIKLTDPSVRLAELELNREALQADFAEFDLSVLITVVIAVNPVLAVVAVPTVLLARRFIMHEQLLAAARIDTKTGLLNASTWEREAETEIARAVRMRIPLAVALVDIDHFKAVNDTYGHLIGDKALRAVTDALRSQLRGYDLAGRFGGEEFVVLLPQAREQDALNVAERLRAHIAGLSVPVDDKDRVRRLRQAHHLGRRRVPGRREP